MIFLQCLYLVVDFDKFCLRGRTLLWLRCTPVPYGSNYGYPSTIALHGRQMLVTQAKVRLGLGLGPDLVQAIARHFVDPKRHPGIIHLASKYQEF